MIDLNGIFHPVAQKIYKYGSHKPLKRLLGRRKEFSYNKHINLNFYIYEHLYKT